MFDFDQTISCNHVFKLLAGWTSDPSCPPEVGATTEFGQLRRITELESAGEKFCINTTMYSQTSTIFACYDRCCTDGGLDFTEEDTSVVVLQIVV